MYRSPFEGAPPGNYQVTLLGTDGNPVAPADGSLTLTVKEDGENDFKINL